jgi:hypothetical protein
LRKRISFYRSHPETYKLVPEIAKKVDFRAEKMEFPIKVPLKMRYMYSPEKELQERPKGVNDLLNFKLMTGNEILLYVEQFQNLRLSEQLGALEELKERDEKNSKGRGSRNTLLRARFEEPSMGESDNQQFDQGTSSPEQRADQHVQSSALPIWSGGE